MRLKSPTKKPQKTKMPRNQNLDRPRTEGAPRNLQSCISMGIETGPKTDNKSMYFRQVDPRDLWGRAGVNGR